VSRPRYPSDPGYSALARRVRAERAYASAVSTWSQTDEEHPAIRAAIGRVLFHQRAVPQLDARTPEAIAWMRESGARPGYLNRTERRRGR